jgi:hypothetical protein
MTPKSILITHGVNGVTKMLRLVKDKAGSYETV